MQNAGRRLSLTKKQVREILFRNVDLPTFQHINGNHVFPVEADMVLAVEKRCFSRNFHKDIFLS